MPNPKTPPPFHAQMLAPQGGKISRDWYAWVQQVDQATGATQPLPALTPLQMVDLYLTDRRK